MSGSRSARRVVLLVFAAASPVLGQRRVVSGVVTDTADRPVRSVTIELPGARPVTTDDSGRFRLEIPHRDRLAFDVRRVGFLPSRFGLTPGGDTSVSIMLFPLAQQLERVDVMAKEVDPALDHSGFAKRREERARGTNTGYFVVAADIDKRNPAHLTQMFDGLPGLSMCRTKNGTVCGLMGSHLIPNPSSPRYELIPCPVTVYLDGTRINTVPITMPVDIDALITPSSVAGFEYYASGNRIPTQYQLLNGSCGLVLVWTKRG